MILRAGDKFLKRFGRCKVLLDGVELRGVWYIDRRRKVLRTFDVKGDGQPHMNARGDGVAWKEIRWNRRQKLELQPI